MALSAKTTRSNPWKTFYPGTCEARYAILNPFKCLLMASVKNVFLNFLSLDFYLAFPWPKKVMRRRRLTRKKQPMNERWGVGVGEGQGGKARGLSSRELEQIDLNVCELH